MFATEYRADDVKAEKRWPAVSLRQFRHGYALAVSALRRAALAATTGGSVR
jgi:hypothetical protein